MYKCTLLSSLHFERYTIALKNNCFFYKIYNSVNQTPFVYKHLRSNNDHLKSGQETRPRFVVFFSQSFFLFFFYVLCCLVYIAQHGFRILLYNTQAKTCSRIETNQVTFLPSIELSVVRHIPINVLGYRVESL